jgi:hypothetical protein
MAKVSQPDFRAYNIPPRPVPTIPVPAPRVTPSAGTPSQITVRENARAEQLPGRIAAGDLAPGTPRSNGAYSQPGVKPVKGEAGGSKS